MKRIEFSYISEAKYHIGRAYQLLLDTDVNPALVEEVGRIYDELDNYLDTDNIEEGKE